MSEKKVPVVFDTDIGYDIDDTWALALLLRSPEVDLKLVVSDTQHTEYEAKLLAKMLEAAGRTDIPVAVGIKEHERAGGQAGWVKGYDLASYPGTVHRDGVADRDHHVLARTGDAGLRRPGAEHRRRP
jgi:inosine-uridine nucleoside N-ribohydrolase